MPDLAVLKQSIANKITGITRLSEYMPLTDMQWAQCPAEERKQWQTLKTWTGRLAADSTAGDDEKLAAMLLDAASIEWPQMPERPTAEAVAPYVLPATPEARSFSKEEARAAIERDWLRQVGNTPDLAREIARTQALATRLGLAADGLAAVAAEVAKTPLSAEKARELYLEVRRIRRALMLRNPVIDFSQLLLVDMPFPARFGVAARDAPPSRLHGGAGRAVVSGRWLVAGWQGPATDAATPLHGSSGGPTFRSTRSACCSVSSRTTKSRSISMRSALDGRGLRQITSGIYDDLDPVYLPDGRNLFFPRPAATPMCAACRRPTPIPNPLRAGRPEPLSHLRQQRA